MHLGLGIKGLQDGMRFYAPLNLNYLKSQLSQISIISNLNYLKSQLSQNLNYLKSQLPRMENRKNMYEKLLYIYYILYIYNI